MLEMIKYNTKRVCHSEYDTNDWLKMCYTVTHYFSWGTRAMHRQQIFSAVCFFSKIERQMFFSMGGHRMSKTLKRIGTTKFTCSEACAALKNLLNMENYQDVAKYKTKISLEDIVYFGQFSSNFEASYASIRNFQS
ncbi:hypothetical protein LXL04_034682 [Taraxacum kok-saghyz]